MNEELRPCPFCGGTNICTEKGINLNYCDSCSAEANIEHWNNRPIEDALNARIAELEEKQRWIPVGERLPEITVPVLFLADWDAIYEGCIYDGKTITLYYFDNYQDSDITHWMQLPELPEVQE